MSLRRRRGAFDIWPGFVDALTSLIMVMIFVLLIFAIGQFVLSDTLSGKNRTLAALDARVAELIASLGRSEAEKAALDQRAAELAATLGGVREERDRASDELAALVALRQRLEAALAALGDELGRSQQAFEAQGAELASSTARADALAAERVSLEEQLAAIRAALELARGEVAERDRRIDDLGKELTVALASRVSELERYRSEFFGRLRAALGERKDVEVVGDRFVLPTDILFDSASAELGPEARARLAALAVTVREIAAEIPSSLDWVLQIDGHTDRRPIHTSEFPSNWELSTARAVAIVKFLVVEGIPANRLSANGFGEFQPLDAAASPEALARNRRIEIKLTSR